MSAFQPHVTFKPEVQVKRYRPSAKPTDVNKLSKSEQISAKINQENVKFKKPSKSKDEQNSVRKMPRRGTAYPGKFLSYNVWFYLSRIRGQLEKYEQFQTSATQIQKTIQTRLQFNFFSTIYH